MKKRCTSCGKLKPPAAFRKTRTQCNLCRGKYWAIQARRRRFGLDPEGYETLLRTQKGKCAICRKKRKLVVDHDHVTGRVRGLLCQPCNMGIGGLDDDVKLLRRAIKYLRRET